MSENNNNTAEEINYNQENSVNEPEVIYEIKPQDDFVISQEWIDEIEERSRRLRSGEDKGFTHQEIMKMAYTHLANIQKKEANV